MYAVPSYMLAASLQHSSDLSELAEETGRRNTHGTQLLPTRPASGKPLLENWRPANQKRVAAPPATRPAPCLPRHDDEREAA